MGFKREEGSWMPEVLILSVNDHPRLRPLAGATPPKEGNFD
ncbi:hypothetical protein [Chryseobacterium sp. sg2396]|nr:hypothetical protein [uncultured Chryseobacterium sp.]